MTDSLLLLVPGMRVRIIQRKFRHSLEANSSTNLNGKEQYNSSRKVCMLGQISFETGTKDESVVIY
jgi:hypothetical protein